MIIKSTKFITSATKEKQYPEAIFPEIAFSGRSNVGKSTLINALINRKKLAKISATPGHTQLINFFLINNSFFFVDLPGYGYAKVPLKVKKKWKFLIENYLQRRKTLKATILIMDIRRNPENKEINLIKWFNFYKIPVIKVLTKIDKLSKNYIYKQKKKFVKNLFCENEDLFLVSSKSKKGISNLWISIQNFLEIKTNVENK